MSIQTNWYVITGSTNSGKSPIIEALAFRGYSVRPEAASVSIHQGLSEGKPLEEEIRRDEIAFQNEVLDMKIAAENDADPNELIFWERGIPDSITYLKENGGSTERAKEASKVRIYAAIVVLDLLPKYTVDHRRTESPAKRRRIHEGLIVDYRKLGYNLGMIPVVPINERVRLILARVKE